MGGKTAGWFARELAVSQVWLAYAQVLGYGTLPAKYKKGTKVATRGYLLRCYGLAPSSSRLAQF